ncbi:MAG: hypothetical protein HN336_01295 [Lentimicrobiaceae bacterium]|jgi:hypothetical protein|nr:hypothetical protein [Lentimicrobiaceae bacterium]MCP4910541.1 hypothetical protein [Bacteroidota bacterium]MBT3455395.1 hypothetical protein [Lentimicrobiaceae bacterium]MBT3818765.1 hypothetical protein [Lentimicrobiaceae bacterium]MBT4062032.1 hypothetical protein [Lentimicrobiaceae bacterium]
MNKLDAITEELSKYNATFNDGFSSHVIEKIQDRKSNGSVDIMKITQWVTLSGIASVSLLLLMIYFTEGSLNMDAVVGLINYSPDEPLLTSLTL